MSHKSSQAEWTPCSADNFLGRKPGRRFTQRLIQMGDCYATVSW